MAERDENGRFIAGNKASPGRAKRTTEREYLALMRSAVTGDDWLKITRRAVKDAIQGNSWARAWLSDYLIGRPPQILELRGAEAAMLAELLDTFAGHGLDASTVFENMLNQLAKDNGSG